MKLLLACIVAVFSSGAAMAEGWSTLSGTNKNGALIFVEPAWDSDHPPTRDYSTPENRELYWVTLYKGGSAGEVPPITYKDQPCRFKENNEGQRIEFSCQKGSQSPLSGATYKIVPNKNPEDCSYESLYVCIRGCGGGNVPAQMVKSWWECESE